MKRKLLLFLIVGLAFSLVGLQPAQALPVVFNLNFEYSGATPPQGDTPWLRATFTDVLEGGFEGAYLKLETLGLVGDEYVTKWLFNIRPDDEDDLNLSSLIFDPFSPPLSSLGLTANTYGGGGAHGFDIELGFPEPNASRFGAGDEPIIFTITSEVFDVNAAFFDVFNNYKNPPFFETVAHVQGIGPGGDYSGWIAPNPNPVPEPATMLLVGMGLIGLAGFGRRRFKA